MSFFQISELYKFREELFWSLLQQNLVMFDQIVIFSANENPLLPNRLSIFFIQYQMLLMVRVPHF